MRRGGPFTYRRLGKRLVVLYLCQLVICLVAVAAGMAGYYSLVRLRPVGDAGTGIGLSLLLRYLPSGGDILLMYLVFLAVAGLFAAAAATRIGWLILVTSIALYAYSQFHSPDWFFITSSPGRKVDRGTGLVAVVDHRLRRFGNPELGGLAGHVLPALVLAGTGAAGGPTSG